MDKKNLDKLIGNFDLSNFPEMNLKIPNFNFDMPKIEVPRINKEILDEINQSKREEYEREVENNENLKALVLYNEEISSYNKELVSLNEKILNKINSLDDTLLLFHKTFNNSANRSESELKANNALLLELITIIDSKDEKNLRQFISGMSGTIGIELLISYFKMKLGLTV
ncbi:hypothetical protein OD350_06245 [Clostridium beijerinckii]|uniref:hypothetical protein n=1 Tax=Clostridium beijerinckii TaxID=1520 RepID=UPI002226E386|nr:hypothetical protein [Clostridium beijerinckii]UYZ37261.1 hypothetical protein OD350_06245 [Clostridium beijerinckii]